MDVVVWLRSLGLGKYEAAFRENDIDETVLPGLRDETLKELGVASIGHRVKLLGAIAALRNEGSGKAPTVHAATTLTSPNAHPEDRAERREVTVMFSDLVGSTAPSARMDPEDLLRTNEISDKTHVGSSGGIQSASKDAARPNAADEVLPTLPLAPTLAPAIAIKEEADANATPGTYPEDGGKEIVKALGAIPIGSAIAFASEDLGALLLADAPIVRGTEAYRQVEHLAQACNCSVSLQEKTNTITFYRNETAIKHVANEDSRLKARGRVGAWGFAYKGSIFVEDRRFLIKLFAIEAIILMVAYIVLASIQSEEARQPEQYLGRSADSQIKAAPTTASGIGGASSSGAQSQREELLALAAEKKRQEEAAAKKEAERLALEVEKKRQGEVAKKEKERLALEAEKERQEEAARKDAERLALEAEKKRQEEAAAKKEAELLALEAEKKRQEEVAKKEAERLALEAEKERQEEAARKDAERLALEAEKKRQEEAAAKKEAERLALEAEKKRQEEVAKKEAERLALEAEKERQEEAARKDAERLALEAEKKRQEELTAPRPNAAGKAQATAKTDQQIVVPNIVGPVSAPETTLGPWVTGTQKPQVTAVQGGAPTAVSADLPVFAPSRVVLTYPRNDKAAAERTTALLQALTAAKVEVVKVEAVDASRPTPGIGYYFGSDHDAAVDVSHRVQPLLGPVEPALLELRGKVPPPGTVEIAVPGRGAR